MWSHSSESLLCHLKLIENPDHYFSHGPWPMKTNVIWNDRIFEVHVHLNRSFAQNLGVWTGIWEFWFMIWDFLFWEIQFRSQKRWSENRSFPFADRHHWWLGIQLRTKLSIDITHKTKIHSVHPNFCHFVFEIKCNDGKVVDHRMFSGYMLSCTTISSSVD